MLFRDKPPPERRFHFQRPESMESGYIVRMHRKVVRSVSGGGGSAPWRGTTLTPNFLWLVSAYSGPEAVITLAGELDLASAPVLHELLLEAASAGAETIKIDVQRLTYVDSAGLGVLVSAHKRLQSNGGSLVISGPTPRVTRVLAISGLTRYFTIRN